jgi:hypothetical protein
MITAENIPMPARVEALTQRVVALWRQGDSQIIPLARVYSRREQAEREAHLARFLDALQKETRRPPRDAAGRTELRKRLLAEFSQAARVALDLQERHVALLMGSGMTDVGLQFARWARRFDPAIAGEDIFQACRNAWTCCGLQILFGRPVQLTPAIFAYSMLYPYTDNYLDATTVASAEKRSFSERFYRRLAGEPVAAQHPLEERIFALTAMIEDQFERGRYPGVFDSLLAIHAAQTRSLQLLRRAASPYETDTLGLSFEKGGTSVLADAYLIAGELTPAQELFAFGWGAFVQLMDDLEDVESDRERGQMTIFSQTAGHWPLDGVTNLTLALGAQVMDLVDPFDTSAAGPLIELMRLSAGLPLVDGAGMAGRYYSRPYLTTIETRSPFRFPFLRQQRKALYRRRQALAQLAEAAIGEPASGLAGALTPASIGL